MKTSMLRYVSISYEEARDIITDKHTLKLVRNNE